MRLRTAAATWTGFWSYLLIFFYVIGTNCYYGMTTDQELIRKAASDVWSYWRIAEAAPQLPEVTTLPFHHAQRFFMPAVVGIVAKTFDLPTETVARAAVVLLFIGCLILTRRFFIALRASATASFFFASLVFLNPYGVRLVLAFPFMLNDLTCVFGMMMALIGLRERRILYTALGATVAALGRQTGIVLLFPIAGVAFFEMRRRQKSGFLWALLISEILLVSTYVLTASIATKMSRPSENVEFLLEFATWLRHSFDAKALLEFLVRGATAHLVVIGALVALPLKPSSWRLRSLEYEAIVGFAFLVAAAGVFLQPLLTGPGRTAGNLQRLTVLGLWPMLMGLYILFRESYETFFSNIRSLRSRIVLVSLLLFYSQHHIFSWPGKLLLRHPEVFFVTQSLLAVGMYLCVKRVRHRESAREGQT
jgi:hypothetical protein